MKTYSQNGQDRAVVELFDGAKNLRFVELGAGNGRDLSNTLLLEEIYGWTGLLVEANPLLFQALRINRPDAISSNALLWSEEGKKLKFWLRDGWMSRIVENSEVTNPPESRKRYRERQKAETTGQVLEMETDTLYNVLNRIHNYRSVAQEMVIDFMSVDLEGAEEAVLQDFPFKDFLVRCLCIERPSENLAKKLQENNYHLWGHLGEDTLYIHKESGLI